MARRITPKTAFNADKIDALYEKGKTSKKVLLRHIEARQKFLGTYLSRMPGCADEAESLASDMREDEQLDDLRDEIVNGG